MNEWTDFEEEHGPERTATPRVEEFVTKYFQGTNVNIEVVKGQTTFEKEYPCLAALNRAASGVPRHDGRVIWLIYQPGGKVEKTLYMVVKGFTYDTGSADIKVGGLMAGKKMRETIYIFIQSSYQECPGSEGCVCHGHSQEQRGLQLLRGRRDHHQQGQDQGEQH